MDSDSGGTNLSESQPIANPSPVNTQYPGNSDSPIDSDDGVMFSTRVKQTGTKRTRASRDSEKSLKQRRVSSKRKKNTLVSCVEDDSRDSDNVKKNEKNKGSDKNGEEVNESSGSDSDFQVPYKNPDFYYKFAQDLWKSVLGREVRSEMSLDVSSCKKYGIYQFLEDRNFLGTVMSVKPYVELVVKAFYANLCKELSGPASKKFGKVFVRNHVYNFSPSVINDYFGMSDHVEDSFDNRKDEIVSFLTGGNLREWKPGFAASKLTSLYSVLHKIAIHNWTPSKNESVVTYEQALLLFKLGKGYNVNFGRLVFGNVTKQAEKNLKNVVLPYPSLIYGVLVSQGFQKESADFLSKPTELFAVHKANLADHKLKDLPWKKYDPVSVVEHDVGNKVSNTPAESVSLPRKIIEAQIQGLMKQIQELTRLKNTLENHLSSQKGGERVDNDEGNVEEAVNGVQDENSTDATSEAEADDGSDSDA